MRNGDGSLFPPVVGSALERLLEDVQGKDLFSEIKSWALDALRSQQAEWINSEPVPPTSIKMRSLNLRIFRLQQAHNISQVIEIVEEQSDTMAGTMLEAFGLGCA